MEIAMYLAGVLLLAVPVAFIVRGKYRLAAFSHVLDNEKLRLRVFNPVAFADLARGWLGTVLIIESFQLTGGGGSKLPFLMTGLVTTVGLLLQHFFTREDDDVMPAPVAYTIGVTLALLPTFNAGVSVIVALATAIAMRNIYAFHITGAASILGLGLLMKISRLDVALAAMLFAAPVALAGMLQRQLGVRVAMRVMTEAGNLRSRIRDVRIAPANADRRGN
ncbi:hypothetical protein OpiT1DRAFT_03205 [Opitutaceae bacterium TAV1]|nr:hypothetical protein OpiT1DRAFT_03205 [Opitutaceae bacterium TAV1]